MTLSVCRNQPSLRQQGVHRPPLHSSKQSPIFIEFDSSCCWLSGTPAGSVWGRCRRGPPPPSAAPRPASLLRSGCRCRSCLQEHGCWALQPAAGRAAPLQRWKQSRHRGRECYETPLYGKCDDYTRFLIEDGIPGRTSARGSKCLPSGLEVHSCTACVCGRPGMAP